MTKLIDSRSARLELDDKTIELPILVGTENERALGIGNLRKDSGYITLDPSYRNTGACRSAITFVDGERGILRYRGIPIEQLAERSTFVETAMLLIWGELPTESQLGEFSAELTNYEMIPEGLYRNYDGFPALAPPMAILSAMINAVSCYHPEVTETERGEMPPAVAARLLSMVRTIAAAAHKTSIGERIIYPSPDNKYCHNFLHMMFSQPFRLHVPSPEVTRALELVLILHADHEQSCSTSTVRMVASSGANLFASCAAGVCSLWGWRHGGANVAVTRMLEHIQQSDQSVALFLDRVKQQETAIVGFGHPVYRTYDPRAKLLRAAAEKLLTSLGAASPLFDVARRLEEAVLADEYFTSRDLYPNVDLYSGIVLSAIGIPVDMYPVVTAIGRMAGWVANWKEVFERPQDGIARPRQLYIGPTARDYVAISQR